MPRNRSFGYSLVIALLTALGGVRSQSVLSEEAREAVQSSSLHPAETPRIGFMVARSEQAQWSRPAARR